MIDLRAHVVTADVTFKGHIFVLRDDGIAEIQNRNRTEVIRRLYEATAESRDGEVYRVVGKNEHGEEKIWRTVKACARCSDPAVYDTPAYDIPT